MALAQSRAVSVIGGCKMRNINEIRAKIDEYLAKLDRASDPETEETYCRTIDALLWVIEDTSGTPI